jgi:hypothetical protein
MRELVRGMCIDWGVSIWVACGTLRFDISTFHYKSRRIDQAAVERRIKEIAETRVRYGYRRVHVLLRHECWVINMKKTRRIYNELVLQLRNKHPKRRVKAKLCEDRQTAVGPNDVWATTARQHMQSMCERGLRSRRARPWQEAPHLDHCRHAFPLVPDHRSAVQPSE